MISCWLCWKCLTFLAVCLHLSVCIRVSVHRCNAYVMSSTLVTAYRSLISLAMPSRRQSLSLSPSWVSNCKLDHLQNARIAHRAWHIAHPWNSSDALVLCIYVDVAITTCGCSSSSCSGNNERANCHEAVEALSLHCVLTTNAAAILVLRTLTSLPSLWLPVYCAIITSLKITGFRLRTQQAKAK